MNEANEATTENVDKITEYLYRYVNGFADSFKRRILFTERGKQRLASIEGYIVGLAHAGQSEFAERMAKDLYRALDYVCSANDTTFEMEGDASIAVPSSKCILSDDGTLHSFGLQWFYPIDPKQWNGVFDENRKIDGERWPRDKTHADLNIRLRVNQHDQYSDELTEYKYADGCRHEVYYRPSYNGVLIYHGPGQGETFTVSLGSSNHLWGIHT